MTTLPKHPAKYSDELLPILAELCKPYKNILDPMAGTGKLAAIRDLGYEGRITCNDLERDWLVPQFEVDEWHFGDAARMDWARDGQFDAICTSPTYGNRMADHHNAQDGSKRYSYTHCIGHELQEGNTGAMQWGKAYQEKNAAIIAECWRVLKPAGKFIINVSNHVRKGQVVDVVGWWKGALVASGLGIAFEEYKVRTRRMRNGENAGARVEVESVLVFVKVKPFEWTGPKMDGPRLCEYDV